METLRKNLYNLLWYLHLSSDSRYVTYVGIVIGNLIWKLKTCHFNNLTLACLVYTSEMLFKSKHHASGGIRILNFVGGDPA